MTAREGLTRIGQLLAWARENGDPPALLSDREVATLLNISTRTVWRRVSANVETDIRRIRRVLSGDEFQRLLNATETGEPFRRISGPDRAMLYLLCSQTGLRAQEAASLTAASFNLDSVPSMVAVEAAYSKRRRKDTIPLRPELADLLCEWLRSRDGLLWPGSWWNIAAQMVEQDLKAARDAWIDDAKDDQKERRRREQSDTLKYQDDAGRYFDFHALRHQFISELVEAGVHPKVAQELARHSTIVLTMDRYAHVETKKKSEALEKLPPLPEIQALNRRSISDLTQNLTQSRGTSWQETAGSAITADSTDAQEEAPKPLDDSSLGAACHAVARGDKEAPPGFEPGMADLQSAALGHLATAPAEFETPELSGGPEVELQSERPFGPENTTESARTAERTNRIGAFRTGQGDRNDTLAASRFVA